MKFARFDNGTVVEISQQPDIIDDRAVTVGDFFHPDLGFEQVPDEVGLGWMKQDGVLVPPSPAGNQQPDKAALRSYAAARRYEIETGGISVAGNAVQTDRESQAMISGAFSLVTAIPQQIQFKTADGFVTLTAEQVRDVAFACGQHVQACFAKESEIATAIETGAITTLAEIDAAFAAQAP